MGTKVKNLGNFFQKSRNKNFKNLGTKVKKIWDQNSGFFLKKIREQKLQKSENKNYKNPGTKKHRRRNN
jgi:hypothetical protein